MILRGHAFSQALEMETPLSILTPEDYSGAEPYKVAYLLHGTCGRGEDFITHTMLPHFGRAYRCVFVMPDVQRSMYADMVYGQRYFTYVAEELPAICKNLFRISDRREDSAVIGISSGGYGALKCALSHPDRYAACAAISPGAVMLEPFLKRLERDGVTPEALAEVGEGILSDFRSAFGERFEWRAENDLLALAKRIARAEDAPRILVRIGAEDGLLGPNRQFAAEMERLPLDFTYEEAPGGGHDFDFFSPALERALAFCMPD